MFSCFPPAVIFQDRAFERGKKSTDTLVLVVTNYKQKHIIRGITCEAFDCDSFQKTECSETWKKLTKNLISQFIKFQKRFWKKVLNGEGLNFMIRGLSLKRTNCLSVFDNCLSAYFYLNKTVKRHAGLYDTVMGWQGKHVKSTCYSQLCLHSFHPGLFPKEREKPWERGFVAFSAEQLTVDLIRRSCVSNPTDLKSLFCLYFMPFS